MTFEEWRERFRELNRFVKKGETVFAGSSLMEYFPVNELMMTQGMRQIVYNRGIGGYKTDDLLESMEECIFGPAPGRIFLNIGTNDIAAPDYREERLVFQYRRILSAVRERLPEAEIFLMAFYPCNPDDDFGLPVEQHEELFRSRRNPALLSASSAVRNLAGELGCRFIDVNAGLTDARGNLKKELSIEGVHLKMEAYAIILENMKPYL